MIYQGKARYPVHELILHTSATPGGWDDGKTDEEVLKAFWKWHVTDNGWRKIGYHRIIRPSGRILWDTNYLRSITEIGAHVRERNRGTLGVCLIPERTVPNVMRKNARFEDYYTEAQRVTVMDYVDDVAALTDLKWVTGHNDYAPKSCPGFKVHARDWLA